MRKQRCLRQPIYRIGLSGSITKSYTGIPPHSFLCRSRIYQRAQHSFRFSHIHHREAQNSRRPHQRIFPLEKTRHQVLPRIFRQIARQFPIPVQDLTCPARRRIFLPVTIGKQGRPIRNSLFAEIKSGRRQRFTRKSLDGFLLPDYIYKGGTSIYMVADAGEIDEIIFQFHIKLRPPHHSCQTGINSSDSRTFFRCTHFLKIRVSGQ